MPVSTVCLLMLDGEEIYFRAPQSEIHRLVIQRHGPDSEPGSEKHVINTDEEVPFAVDLDKVRKIRIH